MAESSKSNPKEFDSYINSTKIFKCGIKKDGNHTKDKIEMANIMNNFFFASVFTE